MQNKPFLECKRIARVCNSKPKKRKLRFFRASTVLQFCKFPKYTKYIQNSTIFDLTHFHFFCVKHLRSTRPVVHPVVRPVVRPVVHPVVRPVVHPVVRPVVRPVVHPVVRSTRSRSATAPLETGWLLILLTIRTEKYLILLTIRTRGTAGGGTTQSQSPRTRS